MRLRLGAQSIKLILKSYSRPLLDEGISAEFLPDEISLESSFVLLFLFNYYYE
jgi:hypothetical protein